MGNQFNDRVDAGLLSEYLARGTQRQKVRQYIAQLQAVPDLCLLPEGSSYLFMRVAGKLRKMSVRSLVYYAMHGKTPVFWPCACKNKSCINPAHQTGQDL